MKVSASTAGVTFDLELVDSGVEYTIWHQKLGRVNYTLDVQQILTRRFLEDQALKLLIGNQDPAAKYPVPPLRIVEA